MRNVLWYEEGERLTRGGSEFPEVSEGRTARGGLTRVGDDKAFPFESWARDNAYPYQPAWLPALKLCGSVAEVFFLRPLLERDGVTVEGKEIHCGPVRVTLQHDVKGYRVDVLIEDGTTRLAVEVDGLAFHHRSREQIAKDYLRQRRIVARGYTVIRFTFYEVSGDAAECWRQIDAILSIRRAA